MGIKLPGSGLGLTDEESYLIDDDSAKGNASFENKVIRVSMSHNLIRKLLRENYRLSRRAEELQERLDEAYGGDEK